MKEVKTLEDKLLMIKEILDSEESAELKVQMVSEVVKLPTQTAEEDEECIWSFPFAGMLMLSLAHYLILPLVNSSY